MSYKIYLVEDDKNLSLVLTSYMQREGWQISPFLTGDQAREAIGTPPDLWILDITLPGVDGYQLIKEIHAATPRTPVIFISARDADIDRVIGLELGSDDYLAKPFLPRELVIRVRKLLERSYSTESQNQTIHPYSLNLFSRVVTLEGNAIDLTSKEFDLLVFFVKNRGQAFSREQILTHVWGDNYFGADRVVDDLVRRLRKKMPELHIETIYGYGYRMGTS